MKTMKNMKGMMIMKNMKKYLSLLLTLALLLTQPLSALAESDLGGGDPEVTEEVTEDIQEETQADEEPAADPEELIVGHPTVMKGDFFTEMFGNDTADIDVRALIHGYNLINWDQAQGTYVFDPTVVRDVTVMEDSLGNHTYYIALFNDLYYCDGTRITAWDYAFSMLLMMSPEIEEIGGKVYRAEHIYGYDAYITGRKKALEGVQVLGDYQLAITLDHEFLPYFFEQGLLLCAPYPINVIAPGCKVYDDGWGVYIGNADKNNPEPVYTADLLRQTIMDPETGYNSHPSVVCGPYVLTEFDGVTAHFEINPYFKGAWFSNRLPGGGSGEIVKPTIQKICFRVADNDTLIQELQDGELHLVNKVVYGPTILEGLQAGIAHTEYPRIGLAFLTFTFDWPTVHEKEVRQAIAWCMDRDALTEEYCQGFGQRVDGYYGIEQWEYLLATHQISYPINLADERDLHWQGDYEKALAAWEALSLENLTEYCVDVHKANLLLDSANWTLNRNGDEYRPGVDDVRCKMIDGELVALDLTMMYPEGNHIVDKLQEYFIDNLNACGIQLTLVPTPMQDLFYSYYRETERTTDMIYLATNFHVIVDPAITYSTDKTAHHQIWNNTYSDDDELYYRAVDMRRTDPKDVYDYVVKWISFQERYNEVLPTIPIYSNIYFDFYTDSLQNYDITAHVTWTQAILKATFSPAGAQLEAEIVPPTDGETVSE